MTTESNICIETDGLGKCYGALAAVRDLSFCVARGEIVGLLGANGAGKTTTLRMLACLLTPTSGRARVCGYDCGSDPIEVKRRLGFLSGDTLLYRRLTPPEVLRYFGRLHGIPAAEIDARTAALIAQLDMGDFCDRVCGKLSSGQQQRVNIARTLIHEPPVLILDEPTTALDVLSSRQVLEAIRAARDAGRGVLFSTHVVEEAELLCDRIVVLHEGRLRAVGTPRDILRTTGSPSLREAFFALADDQPAEDRPA